MQAIRICFVGDSIVNGTGDETALGWAGRLCAEANLRGQITYYNLGIPGDTSADLRARWEGECALRLPADCDGRVVFSCGINDMLIDDGQLRVPLEQSRANLQAILRQARENYHVLLVGPTPVSDAQHNQRLAEIAEIYGQVAAQLEVPYIDLFNALVCDAAYRAEIARTDGAHPRSGGYLQIAWLIRASPQWWFG